MTRFAARWIPLRSAVDLTIWLSAWQRVTDLEHRSANSLASPYSDRIAIIGWTDAARLAGARLATIAINTAKAQPVR